MHRKFGYSITVYGLILRSSHARTDEVVSSHISDVHPMVHAASGDFLDAAYGILRT